MGAAEKLKSLVVCVALLITATLAGCNFSNDHIFIAVCNNSVNDHISHMYPHEMRGVVSEDHRLITVDYVMPNRTLRVTCPMARQGLSNAEYNRQLTIAGQPIRPGLLYFPFLERWMLQADIDQFVSDRLTPARREYSVGDWSAAAVFRTPINHITGAQCHRRTSRLVPARHLYVCLFPNNRSAAYIVEDTLDLAISIPDGLTPPPFVPPETATNTAGGADGTNRSAEP